MRSGQPAAYNTGMRCERRHWINHAGLWCPLANASVSVLQSCMEEPKSHTVMAENAYRYSKELEINKYNKSTKVQYNNIDMRTRVYKVQLRDWCLHTSGYRWAIIH